MSEEDKIKKEQAEGEFGKIWFPDCRIRGDFAHDSEERGKLGPWQVKIIIIRYDSLSCNELNKNYIIFTAIFLISPFITHPQ